MFTSRSHALKNQQLFGSIQQVAAHFNVAAITIRRQIKKGELPATRIGGQIRIRWADVDTLTAQGVVVPEREDQ